MGIVDIFVGAGWAAAGIAVFAVVIGQCAVAILCGLLAVVFLLTAGLLKKGMRDET